MKTHLTVAILILQSFWTVSAQEVSFGSCQIFGQVFGIDPLGGDMLVKSPSGGIGGLRFDKNTIFARASLDASVEPSRITPAEVNDGDLVCAKTAEMRTSAVMAASGMLIASRAEIQKRQKANLEEWSKSGAFGMVVKRSPKEGSFILERILPDGAKENLLVETSPLTRFRQYVPSVAGLSDALPGSLARIRVGERLYVRGDRGAGGTSIRARVILLDGFQALTGTVDSIDALAETVHVSEIGAGEAIDVHIRPSDLFLLNPGLNLAQNETEESPRGQKLQTLDFGDLEAGDSVVVVGRVDDSSDTSIAMNGIALIVDLGEVTPQQSGGQVSWVLGPMRLDLP